MFGRQHIMDEVQAKRRRLNDYTGEEADCEPVETRTPDEFNELAPSMVTVNGEVFPRFPVQISLEEHIHSFRTMSMREDDVIIVSFPNSGARWIWEMTQMLMTGQVEHDLRTKEHATIELNCAGDIEAIPSPRVLCSHLLPKQLSNEIVRNRSRVIHVMRNPKDLVVSYYFRSKQLSLFDDRGFQKFVEDFLKGSGCEGSCLDYFMYLHEMMTWQHLHPEIPVINIFYEDVVKSPVQCVRDLARFLQCSHLTDALCVDIADQCTFQRLKNVHEDDKSVDHLSRILFRDYRPCYFRQGEVGDWKNHFTMALSEHFDAVLADRLCALPTAIAFQYSID